MHSTRNLCTPPHAGHQIVNNLSLIHLQTGNTSDYNWLTSNVRVSSNDLDSVRCDPLNGVIHSDNGINRIHINSKTFHDKNSTVWTTNDTTSKLYRLLKFSLNIPHVIDPIFIGYESYQPLTLWSFKVRPIFSHLHLGIQGILFQMVPLLGQRKF